MAMSGFEPGSSVVGANGSVNCATTIICHVNSGPASGEQIFRTPHDGFRMYNVTKNVWMWLSW